MKQREMFAFPDSERFDNGVRIRRDGQGDEWANQHRRELGNRFYLQDLDAFMGYMAFAKNDTDQLFVEYVPDRHENRFKMIRNFAVVALFDRKKSKDAAFDAQATVSAALYLHLCRNLAKTQPVAPRFFFVVRSDNMKAKYDLIEIDIETGQEKQTVDLIDGQWGKVWEAVGLMSLRDRLRRWLEEA